VGCGRLLLLSMGRDWKVGELTTLGVGFYFHLALASCRHISLRLFLNTEIFSFHNAEYLGVCHTYLVIREIMKPLSKKIGSFTCWVLPRFVRLGMVHMQGDL
jgi:hypothetical protein